MHKRTHLLEYSTNSLRRAAAQLEPPPAFVAKGLFHRAIAESGYFGENTPLLDSSSGPLNQHLELGDKVRVETGLDREACDFLDRTLQKNMNGR